MKKTVPDMPIMAKLAIESTDALTSMRIAEAAGAAAQMVAANIKPGKDLEGVLTLIGDSATIAGSSFGEMSAIFSKAAASNKVQGEILAQLGDRGIPILKFLAEEMGVAQSEVANLAAKGEVDFETFRNAMQKGLGGAAQESRASRASSRRSWKASACATASSPSASALTRSARSDGEVVPV